MNSDTAIGVVIIGRNEGERLLKCLASIPGSIRQIIYVDSGSTDNSRQAAEAAEARVVELDMTRPFTAARARNAGFAELVSEGPVEFVQFIDGDCILQPNWIEVAAEFLTRHPLVAVVCGRRRELFPENSIYNRLCDQEWDTPVGRTTSCGGDALMRVPAFQEAGGFRDGMIAGEEPELCVRLRAAGWEIWRLDAEMTLHDAAIFNVGQWWKRTWRSGHAFAEGAALHGAAPERHSVAAVRRILIWGLALPLFILGLSIMISGWALALFLVYPLQVFRLARRGGIGRKTSWERALFLVLGNFPEAFGVLEYHWRRLVKRPAGIIEYK
jgi:GT2 family glycosyltransferase